MRVQVLEKENSLLSEEKVGVMKTGQHHYGVRVLCRSQLRAGFCQKECLVLESPEDKADLIDDC